MLESLRGRVDKAIRDGRMSGRVWLYTNYHCNLSCLYCLTESSPKTPPRIIERKMLVELATEARDLGYREIGITGGEPFLLPWIEEALVDLSEILPVTVLTNGTLFQKKRLEKLRTLSGRDIRLQISLDRPDAVQNDAMRGPENFRKVVEAIPVLLDLGIAVRIATTVEEQSAEEFERLKALVKKLGVAEEDHVVRPIVTRGRAELQSIGVKPGWEELIPELTIAAAGSFWTPFAPTYKEGRLQADLMLTKSIRPVRKSVEAMMGLLEGLLSEGKGVPASGFV